MLLSRGARDMFGLSVFKKVEIKFKGDPQSFNVMSFEERKKSR